MKHARDDYNRIQDPAGLIPSEEPVFLLRGQDELASRTLEIYADMADAVGLTEIARLTREQARLMLNWPKHKLPDLPVTP